MKISRNWLQTFFNDPLPDAAAIGDALTFHAFEIESIDAHGEDSILDVKVTANRGHDCLSHRGIAKELAAILMLPMKGDPLRANINLDPKTDAVAVSIAEPTLCRRYVAGYIRGVKVGPSPDWLRAALESIGQRPINNVVDATNFVMFNLGQPLHAFDAAQLTQNQQGDALLVPGYSIEVRKAKDGEKMVALDDKEYTLDSRALVIVDGNTDIPIGIAGVKGGKPAGISEKTTDIIIESANFDGVTTRRTAAALKLRTDASSRFEQVISPELAGFGMYAVANLIIELAGGETVGFVDAYPVVAEKKQAEVTTEFVNAVLGTELQDTDIEGALTRLDLTHMQDGSRFAVNVPFERLDIALPEDLVEEVARIACYDKISAIELQPLSDDVLVNANFFAAEQAREKLTAEGYSEEFTSVFSEKGERVVVNKVDGVRPYLRSNLTDGLQQAMLKNLSNKELLGLKEEKLFEIGTVWGVKEERMNIATLVGSQKSAKPNVKEWKGTETELTPISATEYENLPVSSAVRYKTFSKYPFIVRDIALWTPAGTSADDVLTVIRTHAGELLVRSELFDQFEKGGRVSYGVRLVFQSFDKTLTDGDANERMESV